MMTPQSPIRLPFVGRFDSDNIVFPLRASRAPLTLTTPRGLPVEPPVAQCRNWACGTEAETSALSACR